MAAASAAPEAFLTSFEVSMIIDEVQLVPELFRPLKVVPDELRLKDKANSNGRYLLTGSANILALPKLSNQLLGRMAIMTLYPFTTAEASNSNPGGIERMMKMDFIGIDDRGLSIVDAIRRATFPEISALTMMPAKHGLTATLQLSCKET